MTKPINNRLYALHALDLAEPKAKIVRKKRDCLVDPNTSTDRLAKAINRYKKKIEGVAKPRLYIPVPEYGPKITLGTTCNPFSCEQLKALIHDDVVQFAKGVDYNSLHALHGFLLFFQKERERDPTISEACAFTKFAPDSQGEVLLTRGSTCTGQSLALLKMLEDKHKLKGCIIVETHSPTAPPSHAGFILPCKDGLLFVEILAEDPIMILKSKGMSALFKDGPAQFSFEIVELPGAYHTAQPVIIKYIRENSGEISTVQFLLRPVANPDLTIMKRYLLEQNFYPVNGKAADGVHVIKVNPALEKVTFQVGEGSQAKKCSVSFNTVEAEKLEDAASKAFLTDDFLKAFKTPWSLLKEQILFAVKHRQTIKNLYAQVGRPPAS